MEHYVTLLDGFFLPQALALHASLQRHGGPHTLWILCMDDAAQAAFERLGLPDVRLLPLARLETDELRRVKPTRSRGEYCWTLTSFTPRFVFEAAPEAGRVTYVDADLWFRASPAPIFEEFERSGKQVLITDHHYAPEYAFHAAESGRFCVQFVTFTRQGEPVRKWWEERCVEWCYARHEEGKFGDQKYLDDWPERFADSVHVLQRREALVAPWNVERFPVESAIAFHFHALRLLKNDRVALAHGYHVGRAAQEAVYAPYLADLKRALAELRRIGVEPRPQMADREWLARHGWARVRALWSALTVPMARRVG